MAMKFAGGRAIPTSTPQVKQAAGNLARLASSVDDVSRTLKVQAAQTGNPKLNQLAAKASALRQQLFDLSKEIDRA